MIDTSLVPFAIVFVVLGTVAAAVALAVIAAVARDLRRTPKSVVVTVAGPQRELSRAA